MVYFGLPVNEGPDVIQSVQ